MRVTKLIIGLILLFVLSFSSSGRIEYKFLGREVLYSAYTTATAYNSLASQTDSTPWITAAGTRCRKGVIAANHLPIGTKVMIEGFGRQVFVVEDRMNRRYKKRIDIWFRSYNKARQFGRRKIKYYVLAS